MKILGCQVMEKNYKKGTSTLIGFLSERRKNPQREKGRKSLLKLAHKIFSSSVNDVHSLWLIEVFKEEKK